MIAQSTHYTVYCLAVHWFYQLQKLNLNKFIPPIISISLYDMGEIYDIERVESYQLLLVYAFTLWATSEFFNQSCSNKLFLRDGPKDGL